MLFLFGWPPRQRSDLTLMEVSQRVYDVIHYISGLYGYLYICEIYVNLIWYLYLFMLNTFCLSLSLNSHRSNKLFWLKIFSSIGYLQQKNSHTTDICWSKLAYTPPHLFNWILKKMKADALSFFSPDIKDCISSHPTVWNYYMQGSTTVHHFLVWFEPAILRCGPIVVQDYQLYLNPQESHQQICGTFVKMSHQMTLYPE